MPSRAGPDLAAPREEGLARRLARGALVLLALAVVAATAITLAETNTWWVRLFDFPRLQVAALGVAVLGGLLALRRGAGRLAGVAAPALLVAALAYQGWRIAPYTPTWPAEVPTAAESCPEGDRLSLVTANVLMTRRDAGPLLALVRADPPDVLVLPETDAWWVRAFAPLDALYPHAVREPQSNYYGMVVLSRLPLEGARVRHLVQPGVPSVHATLRLPSGAGVRLHAVHPRPPQPGQSTAPRDAELVLLGLEMRESPGPAVVAGDLNDVGWSATSRLFRAVAGVRDPRIGRGPMPTFDATLPAALRWPLDHVFATPHLDLLRLEVLPGIGSDHRPVRADWCLVRRETGGPPPLDGKQREDAREAIRDVPPPEG